MDFEMNAAGKFLYGLAVTAAAVLAAFVVIDEKQGVSLLFWTLLAVLALGRATGQIVPLSLKDDVS